ncbi:MAG: DUF4372 domain-containing protein, partial [Bacteroidales bacterium]
MGLFKRNKNTDKPVIKQILDLIPNWILTNCIAKHRSDKGCSKYKTRDQLVALTFGQLFRCDSLGEISSGIGMSEKLIEDMGLLQSPARS